MHFHTFLDFKGEWLDCIFFPNTAHDYPVTGKGFYAMKGKVSEEFGVYSVEVTECRKIGLRERNAFPNMLKSEGLKPKDQSLKLKYSTLVFYLPELQYRQQYC